MYNSVKVLTSGMCLLLSVIKDDLISVQILAESFEQFDYRICFLTFKFQSCL